MSQSIDNVIFETASKKGTLSKCYGNGTEVFNCNFGFIDIKKTIRANSQEEIVVHYRGNPVYIGRRNGQEFERSKFVPGKWTSKVVEEYLKSLGKEEVST